MEEQIEAALEELANDAPEGFSLRLIARWGENRSSVHVSSSVPWNDGPREALKGRLTEILMSHGNVIYVDVIIRKEHGKAALEYFEMKLAPAI